MRHGSGQPFLFDRLGVRVPAILVSPWVARGTVVGGRSRLRARLHSSDSDQAFFGDYEARSPREKAAATFLDLLTLNAMRTDAPEFEFSQRKSRWQTRSMFRGRRSGMNKQRRHLGSDPQTDRALSMWRRACRGSAGIDPGSIKTEGEAARVHREVTANLHLKEATATAGRATRAKAKAPKSEQPNEVEAQEALKE